MTTRRIASVTKRFEDFFMDAHGYLIHICVYENNSAFDIGPVKSAHRW